MNQDYLSLVNNFLSTHQEVITPGSIEETSLQTAANMMAQGQGDVATQIINSLLMDETIKQACLQILSGESPSQPTPPPVETPIFEQPSSTISSWEPTPTPTPMPTPTPIPPVPPIAPAVPPVPTTSPDLAIHTQTPVGSDIPQPSGIVPDKNFTQPIVSVVPEASPSQGEQAPPHSLNNQDIWNRFNAIVSEEKASPKGDDALSHLQRVEQLSGALEQAEDRVEEKQDKAITEEYDEVFGGSVHSTSFEVPTIIKTYDTAQSTLDKEERQRAEHLSERLDTYKKYFDAAEQYLTRAYGSGGTNIMTSARAQFESLQKRYPEYVEQRSAHIADMQKIIDTYSDASLKDLTEHAYALDETTTIAPGMRMTGENDSYMITRIVQPTAEQDAQIVFTGDSTGLIYIIPATQLAEALQDTALHTDDFFRLFQHKD